MIFNGKDGIFNSLLLVCFQEIMFIFLSSFCFLRNFLGFPNFKDAKSEARLID